MTPGLAFAVSLYSTLVGALGGNAFVSPLSVQLLLLLALSASTPLSSTHLQLWTALFPDAPLPANATLPGALLAEQQLQNASAGALQSLLTDGGGTARLSIASGIFSRNVTLRQEYVMSMQQLYQVRACVRAQMPRDAFSARTHCTRSCCSAHAGDGAERGIGRAHQRVGGQAHQRAREPRGAAGRAV